MKRTCHLAAALLALLLAACASTPPALVALPSYAGATRPLNDGPLNDNSPMSLSLRPVILPGYLDTYAVVLDRSANTLRVAQDSEWAERLRDAVTRTLRDMLSQRLGSPRVLMRGEHRAADADLTIEFLRLDRLTGCGARRTMDFGVGARPSVRAAAHSFGRHLRGNPAPSPARRTSLRICRGAGEIKHV